MLGAVAGDIAGSVYEFRNFSADSLKLFSKNSFFTDDTVLSIAVADSILNNGKYVNSLKKYYALYPHAGYGSRFAKWAGSNGILPPYNSWGNGSAMRVSPVGFAFYNREEKYLLNEAKKSAKCTHNHPEGIKGASAVALAISMAINKKTKKDIKQKIENYYGYNLNKKYSEIKDNKKSSVSCQVTVPQSLICFLESNNFEDSIIKAVKLGGDTDTLGCITGSISHAYYKKIPEYIVDITLNKLDRRLKRVLLKFIKRFNVRL